MWNNKWTSVTGAWVAMLGFILPQVAGAVIMERVDAPGEEISVEGDFCEPELIANGDFETTDDRAGLVHGNLLNGLGASSQKWDVYDALPDEESGDAWFTDDDTSGIEIQYDGLVVNSHSGDHYVELDSHSNKENGGVTNSTMSQLVDLEPGLYLLSFYYQPRTETAGDNTIEVVLTDESEDSSLLLTADNVQPADWEEMIVGIVIEEAGEYKLSFRASGIENTLGGFIDTVSLLRECEEEGPGDGDVEVQTTTEPQAIEPTGSEPQASGEVGLQQFVEGSGCSLRMGQTQGNFGIGVLALLLLALPLQRLCYSRGTKS